MRGGRAHVAPFRIPLPAPRTEGQAVRELAFFAAAVVRGGGSPSEWELDVMRALAARVDASEAVAR